MFIHSCALFPISELVDETAMNISVQVFISITLEFPRLNALEKETATHSSVLAWRIPWTVEPDGLPSMGSHKVRHD